MTNGIMVRNRWLTDVIGKVKPVVSCFSSSDLPTYLVVGGKRIPFALEFADVVDAPGLDGYELELHVKGTNVGKAYKEETLHELREYVRKNFALCYWNEDSLTEDGSVPKEHTIEPMKFVERVVKACRIEFGKTKKRNRNGRDKA